jgi:transcriptional regulator with XRE-family HTH domain
MRQYLRLKFERHARGWRQIDVARLARIPQPTISAIESGRLNPTHAELERLADALRVSPPEALLKPVAVADPEEQTV